MVIRGVATSLMTIIGGLIYIFTRQDIIFFRYIPDSIIDHLNNPVNNCSSIFQYIIVFCLPDGLWYGALLLIQSTFMGKSFLSRSIYWISITLPFIWEILQLQGIMPGTFDPMDICVYLIFLILLIPINNKHHDKEKY